MDLIVSKKRFFFKEFDWELIYKLLFIGISFDISSGGKVLAGLKSDFISLFKYFNGRQICFG